VRTLVDARLRDQARRFALRFACDDCAHSSIAAEPSGRAADFEGVQCSLGYPASPRRDALAIDRTPEGTGRTETIDRMPEGTGRTETIEFCKSFEIA
jgi:hypothetical protein